ncbi:MAG: hypothetical protein LLF76_03045 [Planctomycetaceae bacterium]|nr:hypothetical protein [Planctomycetaceae bacterium]
MKKYVATILIIVSVCCYSLSAALLDDGGKTSSQTAQYAWRSCGSGTSAGVFAEAATEPNSVECDAAYFEANFQTFTVPALWTYIYFRNSSTTEADTTEYVVYFSDGGDYLPAFKLTFTTGTLASSNKTGSEYADTLVAVEYLVSGVTKSPTANYCAMYWCDRLWARKIGIVPVTVTNAAYLEIVGN